VCILDEFAAHVGNVNCLSLGHKSGRVMVSGGDDKKVNMWAVGKPTCILVSTVTCFCFQPYVEMSCMYRYSCIHTSQNVTYMYNEILIYGSTVEYRSSIFSVIQMQ